MTPVAKGYESSGVVLEQLLHVDGCEKAFAISCISMGNPHAIIFLNKDNNDDDVAVTGEDSTESLDIDSLTRSFGPVLECHGMFPAKTNVEFVKILSRSHVYVKVWERGAGLTMACGTGACAVVVAGVLLGVLDSKCKVTLPGGDLHIDYCSQKHTVFMSGPAEFVYCGEYSTTFD